jgi:hypothetical protein
MLVLSSSQPMGEWDIEVQTAREWRFGTLGDSPIYLPLPCRCPVPALPH